jgi:hypothetical protein
MLNYREINKIVLSRLRQDNFDVIKVGKNRDRYIVKIKTTVFNFEYVKNFISEDEWVQFCDRWLKDARGIVERAFIENMDLRDIDLINTNFDPMPFISIQPMIKGIDY